MAVDPALGSTLTTIETTEEHPFLVEATANGDMPGWTRVDELSPGDAIKQFDGLRPGSVVVSVQFTSRREQVHNLEVEGLHTYLVGADGVVVHNGGPCSVFERWLLDDGGQLLRGKAPRDIDHYLKELEEVHGWVKRELKSGTPGGFSLKGNGREIVFHPGGKRYDSDHFNGEPYWKWNDGKHGDIKWPARKE